MDDAPGTKRHARRWKDVDPAVSEAMSRVRSKNTAPEMTVRRMVHAMGYRFRLHRKDLPGSPDLVFPSRRKVIFVHGCFWHGHEDPNCRRARIPKSRVEFWSAKVKRNKQRDAANIDALTASGCPYCHGYELNQRPLGVLARDQMAFHQAMLVQDWGTTTLFTQGLFSPTSEQVAALSSRGVKVEHTQIVELVGNAPTLDGVRLADGRTIELSALFTLPRTVPASDLAERLGCLFEDGPTGPIISTDERRQTSVPGVFAAGDAASPMPQATLAAAAGVIAAGSAHQSIIFAGAEAGRK